MELCSTEIKSKKKLSEKETSDLIRLTAVEAPSRMRYIESWVNNCGIRTDPVLKEYNINVDLKMVTFEGRVMDPPDIQYAPSKLVTSRVIGSKGSWNHRNMSFNTCVDINNWILVRVTTRVNNKGVDEFVVKMKALARSHGIRIARDPEVVDYAPRARAKEEEVLNDVRAIFDKMTKKYKSIDLVMAIFSGTTIAYKAVKTCGDILFGIATQCIDDKNVMKIITDQSYSKVHEQTVSNIMLKINNKLGGKNFVLSQSNLL
jgi:eukaryotic translation initiation factor 2C